MIFSGSLMKQFLPCVGHPAARQRGNSIIQVQYPVNKLPHSHRSFSVGSRGLCGPIYRLSACGIDFEYQHNFMAPLCD